MKRYVCTMCHGSGKVWIHEITGEEPTEGGCYCVGEHKCGFKEVQCPLCIEVNLPPFIEV